MESIKKIKQFVKRFAKILTLFSLLFLVAACQKQELRTSDDSNRQEGRPNPPPGTPTPGLCGPTNNSCLGGTLADMDDTRDQYQWSCNGTGGAANATCSLKRVVDSNCIQIFYDTTTDANFKYLGRTYALMLSNLLGHFPEHQQIIGPVEMYRKGDLEACKATFYFGTNFDKKLPLDFIDDYKTTTKSVIWIGYNFWQLGKTFEDTFGYSVNNGDYQFTTLSTTQKSADGKPGFFRDILYKGETFTKFSTWKDASQTTLVTSFEMTNLIKPTAPLSTVLAQAKHSTTNEIIPWVYQAGKKFFVTEIPFSYIHEGDRYFVFADLLFDFLGEQPRHNAKNAFIRLEDIHPQVDLKYLDQAVNILKKYGIVPHFNIIPIYKDPNPEPDQIVRMENSPAFGNLIKKYKADGDVFIWHGVTHQYNEMKNPFTGISGDDYEFWNAITNSNIAEDSPQYVITRLNDGFNSLKKFNIYPQLWVPPHYHASAMDNIIFGGVFKWNIGRVVYSDYTVSGWKTTSSTVTFDSNDNSLQQKQTDYVSALQVKEAAGFTPFGQLYPYELYGDMYGQMLAPENLGNVQPELNDQVVATRSVDKILADAKRNLVLRDVWASVFYHPFLLNPSLNPQNANNPPMTDLEILVKGLKDLGYNFISMDNFVNTNKTLKGNPKIDLEQVKN